MSGETKQYGNNHAAWTTQAAAVVNSKLKKHYAVFNFNGSLAELKALKLSDVASWESSRFFSLR